MPLVLFNLLGFRCEVEMKAAVDKGPKDMGIENVCDAKLERPIEAASASSR